MLLPIRPPPSDAGLYAAGRPDSRKKGLRSGPRAAPWVPERLPRLLVPVCPHRAAVVAVARDEDEVGVHLRGVERVPADRAALHLGRDGAQGLPFVLLRVIDGDVP